MKNSSRPRLILCITPSYYINMNDLFDFSAVRRQYRDLCDIPACDRTPDQVKRHAALGAVVAAFKSWVPLIESLKALTNGKIVAVVTHAPAEAALEGGIPFFVNGGDPNGYWVSHTEHPSTVRLILGSTGAVLMEGPIESTLRAALIGVEVAR